jgi:serine/threonine protein kinase/Tol biopolymer transport system component
MALPSGTKLGPYEILSALGAGGMGEVYRGRDTRLERDVAIKVLPSNLSSDPSLKQRLEREAKAVSKLSHPHICTLHDIGHQDGVDFLVMELLEGETLEQRLTKGALSSEQTVRYAAQIAEALAKAHKQGLTHRDLKPSNIMLTKSGAKLMDFGLAKQAGPAPLAAALTEMTMEQSKLTGEGTIVGTFQYMAPEQLEGKEADARTDIFALGEVIYEMVTGKPAFSGKSRASLIAAILTTEPPSITQLQPLTPRVLERVVKKCLAKDPEERWQSASDLASELQWMAEGGSQASAAVMTADRRSFRSSATRRLAPWGLIAALAISVAILSWRQFLSPTSDSRPIAHLTVNLPLKVSLGVPEYPLFALSRDGTQLVFVGAKDGVTQLYTRRINQWDAVPITGTEGASRPFLSPDGQWVAFTSGRTLKKVAVAGGPTIDLAETGWGGGSWGADDLIVYTQTYNGGLWKISASGGSPQMLTSPDRSKSELAHWWPQILPDGDTVIFTAFSTPNERSSIAVRSLKTGKEKTLIEGGTFGRYLPGYLIFSRGETLIAVPFDERKLELTGAPVPVLDGIACFPQNGDSEFAVSENGTFAFLPTSFIATEQKLVSIDRKGKIQTIRDNIHLHGGLRLAPDGQRIALGLIEAGHPPDIWIHDLMRGSFSRLTHGPASNFNPIWTPDGKHLLYTSERPLFEIYRKSADGGGTEEAVLTTPNDKYPISISPDGNTLLFSTSDPNTQADLWLAPLQQPKDAKPFVVSPFDETQGTISPDGRWVAYQSDESGKSEIYVVDFPGGANRVQASTDGGSEPVWSRNGKELFYRSGKKFMSVPVKAGASFIPDSGHVLFESDFVANSKQGIAAYDVSPDGQRFYFVQEDSKKDRQAKLSLVLNWSEELKRLAPARSGR